MAGDIPVVAGFDDTLDQVWVTWKTAQGWQGPLKLFELGLGVNSLSVDARQTPEGLVIGVLADVSGNVFYAEKAANGALSLRQVDLYPDDAPVCGTVGQNIDLRLPNNEEAWLNWQVEATPLSAEHVPAMVQRFTAFRRADQTDQIEGLDLRPNDGTNLVLDDEGDGWTCFFDEDPGGSPKIALYAQFRGQPRVILAGDTGGPAVASSRGCEIGVDDAGDVHVVYGNTTTNQLMYQMRVGGIWQAGFGLADTHGPVPATSHLGVAVAWDGTSSTVYQRPINGTQQACVLDTFDQLTWNTTCFVHAGGSGIFPDITTYGEAGYPYALVFGVNPSQVRVALTSSLPGGWVSENLGVIEPTFDHTIAARKEGGVGSVQVAWIRGGGLPSVRAAKRVGAGVWTKETVEPGAATFPSIDIDASLGSVITWNRIAAGQDRLRIRTFDRFAGGRKLAAQQPEPVGRFVRCDLKDNDFGTALELDVHGNPRIIHRTVKDEGNRLGFTSRP